MLWASGCMAAMCERQHALLLQSLLSNDLQDRNTLQRWGSILTGAHAHIYAQAEFALREFHHDPIDTEYAHEYSGFGRMCVCVRVSVVGLGVRPCEGE